MDLRNERAALEARVAAGDATAEIPLGCVLEMMHEHGEAIVVLAPAVEREPDPRREVEARIALGVARQLLVHPEAEATYRHALERSRTALGEHDPLTARACWELGSMLHDEALLERSAEIWIACAQPAWAMRARAFAAMARGDDTAGAAYVAALDALDLAIGDHPSVVDVLIEAALANPTRAHELRERAIRIATETTGAGSQRTADALWTLALGERDVTILERARAELDPSDTFAVARLLHLKALFLDDTDREAALRVREEYLVMREAAVGFADHSLVPMVAEIKAGWEAIGRPAEAEAFLYRCRARATADSWVYRNLTYSIAHMMSAQRRRDELAALWSAFLAAREAACAPDSPELAEAREIVARQLAELAPPRAAPLRKTIEGVGPLGAKAVREAIAKTTSPDAEALLVLADQLTQRGDPRGELIVVQHQLRVFRDDAALLARQRELLDTQRDALLGPLADDAVRWQRGYWDRVDLDLRADPTAETLRAVLAHPSATHLRELHVTLAYIEGDYPQQGSNAPAAIAILAEAVRPTLRALSLIEKAIDHAEGFAWSEGCTHASPPLWIALPNLERLHLGGVDLVHAIAHPRLTHLVLDDQPICSGGDWDLPLLESLDWALYWTTINNPTDCEFTTVDPVWRQPLPSLRDVTLRASFYDCDGSIERPEVRDRIAKLERLLLPASALEDDPVDLLRRNVQHLRHLSRLLVTAADPDDPRAVRLGRELPCLTLTAKSEFNRADIGLDRLP
jgi:hypothetical protein